MNKRRIAIAVAMCAVMLFSMIASSAYIMHEAAHHHDCTGKECPICQFIVQIWQLRRSFGMALLAMLLVCPALAMGLAWRARAMAGDVPALCTLVGRKIRLND